MPPTLAMKKVKKIIEHEQHQLTSVMQNLYLLVYKRPRVITLNI